MPESRGLGDVYKRQHEGRFSRDPLPVFSAGGPCEQFSHGQGCPLFDVVAHPPFPLPTLSKQDHHQGKATQKVASAASALQKIRHLESAVEIRAGDYLRCQLRTGHNRLNHHLLTGLSSCQAGSVTTEHLLLACPLHDDFGRLFWLVKTSVTRNLNAAWTTCSARQPSFTASLSDRQKEKDERRLALECILTSR